MTGPLQEMLETGMIGPEIARKLKRTLSSVYSRMHILRQDAGEKPATAKK